LQQTMVSLLIIGENNGFTGHTVLDVSDTTNVSLRQSGKSPLAKSKNSDNGGNSDSHDSLRIAVMFDARPLKKCDISKSVTTSAIVAIQSCRRSFSHESRRTAHSQHISKDLLGIICGRERLLRCSRFPPSTPAPFMAGRSLGNSITPFVT
jgi:hypothetical protein